MLEGLMGKLSCGPLEDMVYVMISGVFMYQWKSFPHEKTQDKS